jgi:hypothetical protein
MNQMNRLDILLSQWRLGIIRDPDLRLALSVINDYRNVTNERKSKDIQGTSSVLGENNNSSDERSKTKGLRQRGKKRTARNSPEDQGSL